MKKSDTSGCKLALKASEAKYHTFFETVDDAVFVADADTGCIIEANRRAQQLLARTLEELQKMRYIDIHPPETHVEVKRIFEMDYAVKGGAKFDLTVLDRDGMRIPVRLVTTLFVDETGRRSAFVVLHDLRERRRAEAALLLEESRLEAVLKLNQMSASNFETLAEFALEEGVRLTGSIYGYLALLNEDGTSVNLYSLSKSAMRDCRMTALPGRQNVKMSGLRAEAVRLRKPIITNEYSESDSGGIAIPGGHVPICRLMNVPILDDDEVVILAGVANKESPYDDSDVRQLTLLMSEMWSLYSRRKAEEDGRRLETRMKHVQKFESLGVLAGGIAHDFNNILMTILGHVDLARLSLPAEHEATGHLEPIIAATRRAAELCRQMLACAGRSYTERHALNLNDLICEMSKIIEASISKKASIDFHLCDDLPEIEADPSQIRQVILSLVSNASEALEGRSGSITVQTRKMNCGQKELAGISLEKTVKEGCYASLEVIDTGCGMDKATQEQMFDPFFTTKFTGRGLGLAAALGIVRSHHGAIRCSSNPGTGTTFHVLFPAMEEKPLQEQVEGDIGAWRGQGTVLLADDEPEVCDVAAMMLASFGFKVICAKDGSEAVELCRRHGHELVAVMLDLTMPHLDGYEAHIRVKELYPDLPIILMSGYSEKEIIRQYACGGLAGFLQKPFQLQALGEAVRAVLKR